MAAPRGLSRFDLSEFSDPTSVQRLIGNAANAEGLLTARVREQPFSVLLLDEFEKADPAFFDLLLQILGDGRLTDAAGRVADFCNTVVIMTSNLGARDIQRGSAGFGRSDEGGGHFDAAARQFLRPEIYNRLGAILSFQALSRELMLRVTQRHLELLRQRDGLRLRDVDLQLGPGVEAHLAARGYDLKYGARPLKRVLERELMVPLAEALNAVRHRQPLVARVTVVQGAFVIDVGQRQAKEDVAAAQRALGLVLAVSVLRRGLSKLAMSRTVTALENEVPLLAMLERRGAKRQWLSTADQVSIARLGQVRDVLARLSALTQRIELLETETLGAFHLSLGFSADALAFSQAEIQNDRLRLKRELFRLSVPRPDDIVIAVYSEQRDWLELMLKIYLGYVTAPRGLSGGSSGGYSGPAGKLVAFEFVLPPVGRDLPDSKPRREPPKNVVEPMAKLPAGWVGAILHLRGELFHARFLHEAGFHQFISKGVERLCLVEISHGDFADYVPPAGIHRAGMIVDKGTKPRRIFNADERKIVDSVFGESDWSRAEPETAMRQLIEDRLSKAVEDLA